MASIKHVSAANDGLKAPSEAWRHEVLEWQGAVWGGCTLPSVGIQGLCSLKQSVMTCWDHACRFAFWLPVPFWTWNGSVKHIRQYWQHFTISVVISVILYAQFYHIIVQKCSMIQFVVSSRIFSAAHSCFLTVYLLCVSWSALFMVKCWGPDLTHNKNTYGVLQLQILCCYMP